MTIKQAGVGPVAVGERDLAPDLARGLMLALIALANSVIYLASVHSGHRPGPG